MFSLFMFFFFCFFFYARCECVCWGPAHKSTKHARTDTPVYDTIMEKIKIGEVKIVASSVRVLFSFSLM